MSSFLKSDEKIIQLLQDQNRQNIADIYDKYGAHLYDITLQIVNSE